MAKKNTTNITEAQKAQRTTMAITPEMEKYWSERDISDTDELHKQKGDLAEYNYYAKLISEGLDPDLLEEFNANAPKKFEDKVTYAEQFALEHPGFYVSPENYGNYIGEDNVERFKQLQDVTSNTYKANTEGTSGTKNKDSFGARSFSMIAPRTFSKESSDALRHYEYKYSPDKGSYYSLEQLDMDTQGNAYKGMSNVLQNSNGEVPKLEAGLDASRARTGAAIQGIGTGVASIADLIDQQENGKSSVAGNTLQAAAGGAAAGFTIGGPVGAAVGGVTMGAISGITTALGNKKIDEENARKADASNEALSMRHIAPAPNTQSAILEDGTAGATISKPVEVERDELVLQKDILGNFQLKADFHGGKSHAQGGEDYQLQAGDVVFPGKKRKKILESLSRGDSSAIETERLKLPKGLPADGKFEEGTREVTDQDLAYDLQNFVKAKIRQIHNDYSTGKIDAEEAELVYDQLKEGYSSEMEKFPEAKMEEFPGWSEHKVDLPESFTTSAENLVNSDIMQGPKAEPYSATVFGKEGSKQGVEAPESMKEAADKLVNSTAAQLNTPTDPQYSATSFGELWSDPTKFLANPKTEISYSSNTSPKTQEEQIKLSNDVANKNVPTGSKPVSSNKTPLEKIEHEGQPISLTKSFKSEIPTLASVLAEAGPAGSDDDFTEEAKVKSMAKGGSDLNTVLDYVPAAVNIMKGMHRPETVDRRYTTPETIQYKDQSASARSQSDLQRKIDEANAAKFSGGSAQVARAGKAAAGASHSRRISEINTGENIRADRTEARNVAIRNTAEARNIELANMYDNMDAQNRAAIDSYFDQGIHDFGRIANQRSRDAMATEQQATILKNMGTNNFEVTQEGQVKYRG